MSREINRLNAELTDLQKDLELIHKNHILKQEIEQLKKELAPVIAKIEAEIEADEAKKQSGKIACHTKHPPKLK